MAMEHFGSTPASASKALSKEQAAKALGISRRTLDYWLARSHLPAQKDRADKRRRAVSVEALRQLATDHDRAMQIEATESTTLRGDLDVPAPSKLSQLVHKVMRIEVAAEATRQVVRSVAQTVDAVQTSVSAIVPRVNRTESDLSLVLREQKLLLDCVLELNGRLERIEKTLVQTGQMSLPSPRRPGEPPDVGENFRIVEAELKALTSLQGL